MLVHLITRRQKILVSHMMVITCCELGLPTNVVCERHTIIDVVEGHSSSSGSDCQFSSTHQRMLVDIKLLQQLFCAVQQRLCLFT